MEVDRIDVGGGCAACSILSRAVSVIAGYSLVRTLRHGFTSVAFYIGTQCASVGSERVRPTYLYAVGSTSRDSFSGRSLHYLNVLMCVLPLVCRLGIPG